MRNKVYLRNLKRRHFEQYVDYILGEKCYNMKVPTATGERSALQPPWHILLDYEYEMRSHAFKKARKDGIDLGVALLQATQNSGLKELHFTSPITFAAMQRPSKCEPVRFKCPGTEQGLRWQRQVWQGQKGERCEAASNDLPAGHKTGADYPPNRRARDLLQAQHEGQEM